jgi:hypothetical protein
LKITWEFHEQFMMNIVLALAIRAGWRGSYPTHKVSADHRPFRDFRTRVGHFRSPWNKSARKAIAATASTLMSSVFSSHVMHFVWSRRGLTRYHGEEPCQMVWRLGCEKWPV